ncbi:YopX family protein [Levilactobacillus namurensis]|uniref:YopX family protein n=1 Tax=Levilactobacillus namurensis TaxID=380393 RepID=UPI0028B4588E|nr:YopX family protein [Levilactobacillus namurensis]MDT7020129.1 YopX family protein [Levilactobacillus namurensis]
MVPKFRAYIKDLDEFEYNDIPHKGHFVYGNLIKGGLNYDVDAIVGNLIEITDEYVNAEWWKSIKKGSAEQSTGLKDANGKEIYEDDVLKNPKYRSVVKFGSGSFYADVIGAVNRFPLAGEWQTSVVIGNVHTNPELLEAQHD